MTFGLPTHEIAALGAALCWAVTGLISAAPSAHLGAPVFNRTRQLFVTALLAVQVTAAGTWGDLGAAALVPLVASGVIGIFVGDTLLFAALNRVGPRRAGILFALNAPIAALLGWLVLGETLDAAASGGVALTVTGVVLAIAFGGRPGQTHRWETIRGPLWIGVAAGLGAAAGQAAGSLIARPAMASGIDPFAASMVRVGVAAACLTVLTALPIPAVQAKAPLTLRVALVTALTGFIALAIGMTLLLYGLSGGQVGIISTLSATSPALILPMIWARTGERPAAGAWAGAGLVIAGMALIFLR